MSLKNITSLSPRIREIFYTITPDNIKADPLYSTMIEVFLQEVEEKCEIALNINNIFSSENVNVKLQYIRTYLESFYSVISQLDTTNLVGSMFHSGDTPIAKIEDIITREFLNSAKQFKENKGTTTSIAFAYKLIESLNTIPMDSSIEFLLTETPNRRFYFDVEGNLTYDVYDKTVKQLAHPVGFAYIYTQVIAEIIHDYFLLNIDYVDVELKVVCQLAGEYDFTNMIMTDPGYKVVDIVSEPILEKRLLTITFFNGEYLTQLSSPEFNEIYLHNPDGSIKINFTTDEQLKYTHCAIELSYIPVLSSKVKDVIVESRQVTTICENAWTTIDGRLLPAYRIGTFDINDPKINGLPIIPFIGTFENPINTSGCVKIGSIGDCHKPQYIIGSGKVEDFIINGPEIRFIKDKYSCLVDDGVEEQDSFWYYNYINQNTIGAFSILESADVGALSIYDYVKPVISSTNSEQIGLFILGMSQIPAQGVNNNNKLMTGNDLKIMSNSGTNLEIMKKALYPLIGYNNIDIINDTNHGFIIGARFPGTIHLSIDRSKEYANPLIHMNNFENSEFFYAEIINS